MISPYGALNTPYGIRSLIKSIFLLVGLTATHTHAELCHQSRHFKVNPPTLDLIVL